MLWARVIRGTSSRAKAVIRRSRIRVTVARFCAAFMNPMTMVPSASISTAPSSAPSTSWWSAPIGLAGGALSALFGTGGVLFAIYNSGRIHDKAELRATNAAMIMLSSLVRVVLFGATGLLSQDGLITFALLLVPAMLAGFYVGNRLHAAVPAAGVVRAVYALLVVSGLSLLARAAAG